MFIISNACNGQCSQINILRDSVAYVHSLKEERRSRSRTYHIISYYIIMIIIIIIIIII